MIKPFVPRMLRPVVSHVTAKNTTDFIGADDVVLIAQFASTNKNLDKLASLRRNIDPVAKTYHDRYSFAVSDEPVKKSTLTCYNNVDGMQSSTTDLAHIGKLVSFVKNCAKPLIPDMWIRNEMELYKV